MKIVLTLIVVIAFFFALVRYLEKTSIFYPDSRIEITPDRYGLPYEDVYFTTQDDLKINGWLLKNPSARSTILYFHGNAGNMSHRLGKIKLFYDLGVNVFIVDYRGYGRSQGQPTEQGVYLDARAAFDYLTHRADFKDQAIVVYGGSLGGAVACDLAVSRGIQGLIVDSSFPSAAAMSRLMYPMIPTFFLNVKFDSKSKIKQVTVPSLFLHSVDDDMIPVALGKELYGAATGPSRFVELTGRHNDAHLESKDKFLGEIRRFLLEHSWL